MITWFMVGLLLAAETTCGRNVDLENENRKDEMKHQDGLNAVADEEDTYRLTCYTCVNVSDNQMCNEWAIDTPCPADGKDFCRSLHILDSNGNSVLVRKSCASEVECGPASVGCIPIDTQKICISCCDLSYCNVDSPTNATSATFSRKRRTKSKPGQKRPQRNGVDIPALLSANVYWLLAFFLYAYHC